MIILGVDPGTATTGWGVIKKTGQTLKCLDCGIIQTSPKLPAEKRLEILHGKLSQLIKKIAPDVLAVENLFFFKNLKTAMPVSEARGVILLTAAQFCLEIEHLLLCKLKWVSRAMAEPVKNKFKKWLKGY